MRGSAFLISSALISVGCAPSAGSQDKPENYDFKPDASRKYPQVTLRDAPTIAALKTQGMSQSGWDGEDYSCGPSCDAEITYAVFMGHVHTDPIPNEHLFTCPSPEGQLAQDKWLCEPFRGIRKHQDG